MSKKYRVLFVSSDRNSEKARKLVSAIDPIINSVGEKTEVKTPLLITEHGRFEGVETIKTYCKIQEKNSKP